MTAAADQLILVEPLPPDWPASARRFNDSATLRSRLSPAGSIGCLATAVLQVAESVSEQTAIIVGSDRFTYGSIASAIRATASLLIHQASFQAGQPVAIMLDNSPEYLAAFYGTLLAGGVAVPLPPTIERMRLRRILDCCGAQTVLTSPCVAQRRKDLPTSFATSIRFDRSTLRDQRLNSTACEKNLPLAMILFTSGSSGDPKGVMLSHQNLLSNAASITAYLPINTGQRALALLPFYHAYGNSVLQTHLLSGATLIVDGTLTFPSTVIEALQRHRATSFAGVPEAYYALLRHADFGRSVPHLEYMTVAGGRLRPESVLEVAARIAPADFYVMYGQSEATARLAYLPPRRLRSHPGSIGKAIPGVELRILDDAECAAERGVVGELCARGPNIMSGYWNDPEASQETLRNGWLHTGDLASMDANGLLYIHARKNDLIKSQGLRIHPREVEDVITHEIPGSQVVVVPFSQHTTTRLALYLIPGPRSRKATIDQIREICVRELPRPKIPAHIEILDELPLNPGMKIDRVALSRRAELRGNGNPHHGPRSEMRACG